MKRHIVCLAAAALFALGATAVWAQPTQDGGGRPSGSGGGTGPGNAASGGGSAGSGGSVSGGGGGSTASTSSGSTGGGGGSSVGWGDRPGVDFPRASAPMRGPGAAAAGYAESQGRTRGGGDSQGRAVPRGTPSGGGNSGGGEGPAVPRGEGGDRGAGRGATTLTVDGGGRDSQGPQRQPVPSYSRPREGRTPIGAPVERGEAVRRGGGIGVDLPWWYYGSYYGYPGSYGYYSRYGWYPGYGFGLGYFYDPFWSGYGGYGYGGYPYGGYGGYGGGSGYYSSRGYDTGSLRLKVQPRDAKVYVDGYFVGVVDSFDGVFQKLAVEGGTHRVEIRAEGFEPAQFEIMVTPGETITYRGELKRVTQ